MRPRRIAVHDLNYVLTVLENVSQKWYIDGARRVITNLLKIHDIRQIVRAELDIPGSEPAVTIDHLGCKAVSGRQRGWSPTAIRNQIQCVEAMEGRIRRWAGNGNEKIGTNFGWNDEDVWCICN
jgi:hypothetical protein